ncbi:helix-turn-helix domain-containing protein [Streptomyces europaeiscabiei]|uniref:helix-turn-helix domain-containing protein n=1 Tax=Streptomyces europaeiscabiei TaxID=146819 RepID=UPI0038F7C225
MPRWRALPDELDPQVREFAGQLRRLVDRSGLSIAAVADRTGYSKTSWERYLNGRLLAPKGAIVALAEVTGTDPVHLTTMWELAERAWSRSEMRHDMTMEAIRISQARAALGETGGQSTVKGGRNGRGSRSATATPGVAGPAGVSPTVPAQPRSSEGDRISRPPYGGSAKPSTSSPSSSSSSSSVPPYGGAGGAGAIAGGASRVSWGATPSSAPSTPSPSPSPSTSSRSSSPSGLAGGPPFSGSSASSRVPAGASAPGGAQVLGGASMPSGVFGPPPGGGGRSGDGDSQPKRRVTMFLAGAVGALVVIAAAFFLTNGDGKDQAGDKPPTSPSTSIGANPDLPAGVKCSGKDCDGKDPETMGCIGNLVRTADEATVGTTRVEVRYSKTCQAAWARITGAAQGDEVQVAVGMTKRTAAIEAAGDNIAYTQMIAVKDAGEATACATLASGQKGCTG